MDQLWALKRNFELVRFGSWLFRVIRCTTYRCPYCNWVFKVTWGPSNSLLGRGSRKCWHCDQTFWDGSNEWPEMNSGQRRLFLLPITIVGYIGAFLVIFGLVVWTSVSSEDKVLFDYRLFFLIFILPLVGWFTFRSWQINRSIRRYNASDTKELS
jgi:hypothetical protein